MDCERCQDELPSFLYGEADELRAAAVRRHLEGCARCRAGLERCETVRSVVRSVPPEGPSPELDRTILAAARDRADRTRRSGAAKPNAASVPPGAAPWSRAVSWLGSAAMRPQVAMALLLLLMVGVGLWYLPQARRAAEWMRAEVTSDHEDEHVSAQAESVVAGDAGESSGPSAEAWRGGDRAPRRWGRRDAAGTAAKQIGSASSPRSHWDRADQDESPEGRGPVEVADAGIVAAAAPPLPVEAPADAGAAASYDEPIAANLYARAMNHYRAGRYGEAIGELEAVTRRGDAASLVPRAYLNLARSHRAAGSLAVSARTYETLLSRWPGFGQRSQAMWEAAVVYRRLGQLGRSRALLERLVDVPTHSARARRELVVIGQGERAASAAGDETTGTVEGGL